MPFLDSAIVRSGRFTDIHLLGRGASGQVYYAHDTRLNVSVAIKEVLPTEQNFQKTLDKFRKESQIQARLRHTNIISVYDLKEDPQTGEYYLVCEYANAGTLAEYLQKQGSLSESIAIGIALDVCAALEKIWSEQIVHCDIKPANILLTEDPFGAITAKLGDFGIAQDLCLQATTVLPASRHPGTPLYMAPEQWNSANTLDVRTDIYGLGATLFEMLTGKSYKLLLSQTATPNIYQSLANDGMVQVTQKAVHEDRTERYQIPKDMANDLRAVLQSKQIITESSQKREVSRKRAGTETEGVNQYVGDAVTGTTVGPLPEHVRNTAESVKQNRLVNSVAPIIVVLVMVFFIGMPLWARSPMWRPTPPARLSSLPPSAPGGSLRIGDIAIHNVESFHEDAGSSGTYAIDAQQTNNDFVKVYKFNYELAAADEARAGMAIIFREVHDVSAYHFLQLNISFRDSDDRCLLFLDDASHKDASVILGDGVIVKAAPQPQPIKLVLDYFSEIDLTQVKVLALEAHGYLTRGLGACTISDIQFTN